MKILIATLFLISLDVKASAFLHICDVVDAESDIVKVDIVRGRGAPKESLSVYYKDETVESFAANYYDDVSYIGYETEDKKFDLYLNELNADGVWTKGLFYDGNHPEKPLAVICH